MIVHETQEKYHLNYLKTLKPISAGHFDNEVLNDGYHRVLLSRLGPKDGMPKNEVTIEAVHRPKAEPERYSAKTGPLYCEPSCCGLASEPAKVARRITELLAALGRFEHITNGRHDDSIARECEAFRLKMHSRLIAEGWRIYADDKGWKVLQPLKGKRNDNHERGA